MKSLTYTVKSWLFRGVIYLPVLLIIFSFLLAACGGDKPMPTPTLV